MDPGVHELLHVPAFVVHESPVLRHPSASPPPLRVAQVLYDDSDDTAGEVVVVMCDGALYFYSLPTTAGRSAAGTKGGSGGIGPDAVREGHDQEGRAGRCTLALRLLHADTEGRDRRPHELSFATHLPMMDTGSGEGEEGEEEGVPWALVAVGEESTGVGEVVLYRAPLLHGVRTTSGAEVVHVDRCGCYRSTAPHPRGILRRATRPESVKGAHWLRPARRRGGALLLCVTPVSIDLVAVGPTRRGTAAVGCEESYRMGGLQRQAAGEGDHTGATSATRWSDPERRASSSMTRHSRGSQTAPGEVRAIVVARYMTRSDWWLWRPACGLLLSINAASPNCLKLLRLHNPPEPETTTTTTTTRAPSAASTRTPRITACPTLRLPTSGQELHTWSGLATGKGAVTLTSTGTHYPSGVVGLIMLYARHTLLYHVEVDHARVVLYACEPSMASPFTGSQGAEEEREGGCCCDGYRRFAELSLRELPSVRQHAVRVAARSGDAGGGAEVSTPRVPVISVQVCDHLLLIHSPQDRLTSVFDVAMGAKTHGEGEKRGVHDDAGRVGHERRSCRDAVWHREEASTPHVLTSTIAGLPQALVGAVTASLAADLDSTQTLHLSPLLTASFAVLPGDGTASNVAGAGAPPGELVEREVYGCASGEVGAAAERVCSFLSGSIVPLHVSAHAGEVVLRAVDVNPITIAHSSELAGRDWCAPRVGFLLRRRGLCPSPAPYPQALRALLLSALQPAMRPDEAAGVLVAVAQHQAWLHARPTPCPTAAAVTWGVVEGAGAAGEGDSRQTHPASSGVAADGEGSALTQDRVARCLLPVVGRAGGPHSSGTRTWADTDDDDDDDNRDKDGSNPCVGGVSDGWRESPETHRAGTLARAPHPPPLVEVTAHVRAALAALWVVTAYVDALLDSGQAVEEGTVLALLDSRDALRRAAVDADDKGCDRDKGNVVSPSPHTCGGAEAAVLAAHVRSAEDVTSHLLHNLLDAGGAAARSPAVACRLLCASDGHTCRNGADHALRARGLAMLRAAPSVDLVMEATLQSLACQRPTTAARVIHAWVVHRHGPRGESEADPRHGGRQGGGEGLLPEPGWGEGEEEVVLECMYVVLRGAAEAVDANGLAHHLHTVAERARRCSGSEAGVDGGREVVPWSNPSHSPWRASCVAYLQCFELIAPLLALTRSPAWCGGARSRVGQLDRDVRDEPAVFQRAPKNMAAFANKYADLVHMLEMDS